MSLLDPYNNQNTDGRFNFRCIQTKKLMLATWVRLSIMAKHMAQYRLDFPEYKFKLVSMDDEGKVSDG